MEVINPFTINSSATIGKKAAVTKSQLTHEVSSSQSNLYALFQFRTYNPDSLVGRKGLEIYKKMKTDDQVKACLTIKKFARLSTPWDIKAGDAKNPQSIEMADFIRHTLRRLKGTFEKNLMDILSAMDYGFSLTEKVFKGSPIFSCPTYI